MAQNTLSTNDTIVIKQNYVIIDSVLGIRERLEWVKPAVNVHFDINMDMSWITKSIDLCTINKATTQYGVHIYDWLMHVYRY